MTPYELKEALKDGYFDVSYWSEAEVERAAEVISGITGTSVADISVFGDYKYLIFRDSDVFVAVEDELLKKGYTNKLNKEDVLHVDGNFNGSDTPMAETTNKHQHEKETPVMDDEVLCMVTDFNGKYAGTLEELYEILIEENLTLDEVTVYRVSDKEYKLKLALEEA